MRIERLLMLLALVPLAGCAGSAGPAATPADPLSQVPVQAVELPEEQVAGEIQRLLLQPTLSAERLNRLASVTRALLRRAGQQFQRGQDVEGMRTTMGALYLIHPSEHRPALFLGSEKTLLAAASHAARLGDEGRSLAFYRLAHVQLPKGAEQADVDQHLSALADWQTRSNEPGTMQAAGSRLRTTLNLSLVACTPETLEDATQRSVEWLERAIVEGRREEPPATFFEHDERMEARRAVMTSALALTALYLRGGDVNGALRALQREPIASAASDKLVERLENAQSGGAEAWADLFGLFESAGDAEQAALDPELARGAAFGAAVGLYRIEPEELRAAIPLATLLVEQGMADVAPLVLSQVVGEAADPRELGWALRLVYGAQSRAEQNGDLHMARRVFENAAPLLTLAARAPADTLSPSAADFHAAMGAMEARAGQLERARPHLARAVATSPSKSALRLLSAIDRQQGALTQALTSAEGLRALAEREGDASALAWALMLVFELQREAGQVAEAERALGAALEQATLARSRARTGTEIAVGESLLAEVLEHYGALAEATRASHRAMESSQHDLGRLTASLLDASRRALTHWDVASARDTLRRSLDAQLEDDDLVYVALWTMLVQARHGVTSDGAVEEAFMRIPSSVGWTSTLRDWGKRTLSDEQLLARAEDVVQRTEAEFYVAMSAYVREFQKPPITALDRVAKSAAIELVEVRIARDLVAGLRHLPTPRLPAGTVLP